MSDDQNYLLEFARRDMVNKTQRLNLKLNHEISKNQDYEQKIKILEHKCVLNGQDQKDYQSNDIDLLLSEKDDLNQKISL